MRITVFDKALQKKAIFFHCLSIFWETRYFGKSSFCIEFGAEELTDISIDVMDYITSDIDETVMIVTSVVYKKQHVTVSGFSADYILHFRVNPLELAGGKAETLIRSLVADMASWDNLSLDDAAGITDTYNGLLLPGTVLDAVQVISQGCDIGIRVRKDGDALKFGCYKPGEVKGYFASPLGNMGDENYTVSDQNFANVAIVKGGGGVSVTAGDTSASGAERRELFVDASSETQGDGETAAAYQERLRQIGLAALAERARIALSEFVLDDDTVKVGDLVRVKPSYIPGTITARITSIAYKSQNNTIKRTVGVGTPIRRS